MGSWPGGNMMAGTPTARTGSTSYLGRTSSWGTRRFASRLMNVRRTFIVNLIGAGLFLPLFYLAQSTTPADQPVARTDQNSLTAHSQLLEKAKKGTIDIYFEGDSITRRWGATDYPELLANWNQNFFGWNAANFGWGADTTQNILWRLNNGELDGINPKVIVLLAGTNNVGRQPSPTGEEARVADISRGLKAIVETMRRKAPQATILVMGIFPSRGSWPAALFGASSPQWPSAPLICRPRALPPQWERAAARRCLFLQEER